MTKVYYLLIIVMISNTASAYDWEFGAEISNAEISGLNAYKADQNLNIQKTKSLTVPSLFASMKLNDRFNLNFRYSYYNEIVNNGISSDGDIFNEGGAPTQVVVNYRIFETMHELTTALKYTLMENEKWNIGIGPNISITESNADFKKISNVSNNGVDFHETLSPLRSFSETSFSIGAELSTTYKFSDKFKIGLNYRFTNPSDKDIHLFGIASYFSF